MARTLSDEVEYLHPYFVASREKDLDAAFEDGKRRAIASLHATLAAVQYQIDRIQMITRADYSRHAGSRVDSADSEGAKS
jgi:hypothetical protein